MPKKLTIFFGNKRKGLKNFFLLHNKNSELMNIRSFNVTPVSHFIKAEPLDKIFFKNNFSIFKCVSPKKNFLSMMNKKA